MVYGIPESVLSDNGKEFRSKVWDAVCVLLDIDRINTVPYHPEGNGNSERDVQTTKMMIRAYVDYDQLDWDLNLPKLSFAYNSSIHETTKIEPFYAMFLRHARIPIDCFFPNTYEYSRPMVKEQTEIKQ